MVAAVAFRTANAPAKPKGNARLWWSVHQWAGLKLSILLSFVLLTGTLAVVSAEMDWLMRPAMRVAPGSVAGPVNWPAIARNAAAHSPNARIQSVAAPIASAFAATVTIEKSDGELRFLYAHPSTGVIQGEGHWVGAARILRNMHRHLNMPTWIGVPIVSALALLLAVSLATSLVVYKKWWRGFGRSIRTRDARTGWGDFHRLAGVWSLWFIVLIIVTGIWYLAESTVAPAPPGSEAEVAATGLTGPDLVERLDASLAAARAADPVLRIRQIGFPGEDEGTFVFQGQKDALLVRPRANSVWTNARNGRVLLVADAHDLSVHQRISEAADPLHFGTFAGYWSKIPWFLFGALLTALSISGTALYSLRLLKTERAQGAARPVLVRAWKGMGWWRWPALGLVLTGFALLSTRPY